MIGSLAKLNDATPVGSKNYFNPGVYSVEVVTVAHHEGRNGECVVAQLKIVDVLTSYEADASFQASNQAGEIVSAVWVIGDRKFGEYHLKRLRQFAEALLGDVEDFGAAMTAVCEDPCAVAGTPLTATATKGFTRENNRPVVNVFYSAG